MSIPFVTANLIDTIKVGATVDELLPTSGLLVLLAIVSLVFGAAAGITCSHASCGFAKNLRHDLFYKIQTFSFANIDDFSSSSLVTRLTTDITNVQQAFMMMIRIAVRSPLVLVFAFVMAFAMGGSVAMVYLVIIPILGFGLFYIIHLVRPIFSRVFHKYDALNESVEENVSGMRVVKSFVREDYEKSKFGARRPGRLRRLHPRREAPRLQQPDDEHLRQRRLRGHHPPGLENHHHHAGTGFPTSARCPRFSRTASRFS